MSAIWLHHSFTESFNVFADLKTEACPGCVAQWTECQHENPRVTGSIPSQGTCLGCGPGPQ